MFDISKAEKQLLSFGGSYILNHAKRTLHISKFLAETENLTYDDEALTFACYFHDISAFKPYQPDGDFDHALESSLLMPTLTKEYGITNSKLDTVIEATLYHNKKAPGLRNEAVIMRNADAVDYLGFIAVARDFSKQHSDMAKALTELKKHKTDFHKLLDLKTALIMAEPRIKKLDFFIAAFEAETFGMF